MRFDAISWALTSANMVVSKTIIFAQTYEQRREGKDIFVTFDEIHRGRLASRRDCSLSLSVWPILQEQLGQSTSLRCRLYAPVDWFRVADNLLQLRSDSGIAIVVGTNLIAPEWLYGAPSAPTMRTSLQNMQLSLQTLVLRAFDDADRSHPNSKRARLEVLSFKT
jgi:hypothetical protein